MPVVMDGWGTGHWGWCAWVPMTIMMLVFLAVVVWAVIMLTHSWTSRSPYHDHGPQATEPKRILDERFARGDIDEEEYRKRRDILYKGR